MLLNESPVKTSSLRQPPLSSGDFLRALQPRSPFLIICRQQTSGHLRGSRWSSSVTVNLFLLVTGWTQIWWSLNSAHLRGVNQWDAVCLYWQSGAADLGWQKLLWAAAEELDLLLCFTSLLPQFNQVETQKQDWIPFQSVSDKKCTCLWTQNTVGDKGETWFSSFYLAVWQNGELIRQKNVSLIISPVHFMTHGPHAAVLCSLSMYRMMSIVNENVKNYLRPTCNTAVLLLLFFYWRVDSGVRVNS